MAAVKPLIINAGAIQQMQTGDSLAIANGGTGAVTQQAAINALAGGVGAGLHMRGDGTNVTLTAIQAADVPTLNQSTSGNSGTATALQTARNINGVPFDGTANITITASAGNAAGPSLYLDSLYGVF